MLSLAAMSRAWTSANSFSFGVIGEAREPERGAVVVGVGDDLRGGRRVAGVRRDGRGRQGGRRERRGRDGYETKGELVAVFTHASMIVSSGGSDLPRPASPVRLPPSGVTRMGSRTMRRDGSTETARERRAPGEELRWRRRPRRCLARDRRRRADRRRRSERRRQVDAPLAGRASRRARCRAG